MSQQTAEITDNPFSLLPDTLYSIATRNGNKKRNFLFASKVIGKYIAVHPHTPILISKLLATLLTDYPDKSATQEDILFYLDQTNTSKCNIEPYLLNKIHLPKKTLFIGFAETATGLAHGVFNTFSNASYFHTTRYNFPNLDIDLNFQEEHSHATNHNCYAQNLYLNNYEHAVLIDDELTTGNTMLNLIRELHNKSNIKTYEILTILDWREESHKSKFTQLEQELDVEIKVHHILAGSISDTSPNPTSAQPPTESSLQKVPQVAQPSTTQPSSSQLSITQSSTIQSFTYTSHSLKNSPDGDSILTQFTSSNKQLKFDSIYTGRFGVRSANDTYLIHFLLNQKEYLRSLRQGTGKCLCLGSEEFIFIPNILATLLGNNTYFACSARSPILPIANPDYPITHAIQYISPEDEQLPLYLYNIPNHGYEEIFWFSERNQPESFKSALSDTLHQHGVKYIHFINYVN